jgi:hypothetical protein
MGLLLGWRGNVGRFAAIIMLIGAVICIIIGLVTRAGSIVIRVGTAGVLFAGLCFAEVGTMSSFYKQLLNYIYL